MKKRPAKPKPPELPKEVLEFFAAWGKTGGKKAATTLSPEERKARAKKAAQARWGKKETERDE
jgi:hypothetical protein